MIGGHTIGGTTFDALVFGYYEGSRLMYVARSRNGFTPSLRAQLMQKFLRAAGPCLTPRRVICLELAKTEGVGNLVLPYVRPPLVFGNGSLLIPEPRCFAIISTHHVR